MTRSKTFYSGINSIKLNKKTKLRQAEFFQVGAQKIPHFSGLFMFFQVFQVPLAKFSFFSSFSGFTDPVSTLGDHNFLSMF